MFNVSAYVFRAAESIKSQAFDGLEVVLVDDGSTDNSMQVSLEILKHVSTITIKQKNKGLSCARNAGIKASTGEYLLFLDADDFLLPHALKNINTALNKAVPIPDVLFGRYKCFTGKKELSSDRPYSYNPPNDAKQRTEYILCNLPQPSWNAWRYVCRREFIINNKIFFEPGLLCEDVPWTLMLLETANTIRFLQEPFYAYYRRRQDSIMNQKNPKRIIDLNMTIANLIKANDSRPNLCRVLVQQSFLYINEYCTFSRGDKKLVHNSYLAVFPLYKHSNSVLHHIAAKGANLLFFYNLSVGLFIVKHLLRMFRSEGV